MSVLVYHAWVLDDPVMVNNTDKCENQITIYPFNTCRVFIPHASAG